MDTSRIYHGGGGKGKRGFSGTSPVPEEYKVMVSSDDTTPNYAENKVVAGTGITVTTLNPGADETLSIAATGAAVDEKVKVSAADTTTRYLADKITYGTGINTSVKFPGADERFEIENTLPETNKVMVSVDDTTPNYAESKLAAGSNIALSTLNPGGNEQVQIAVTGIVSDDKKVMVSVDDTTPNYAENKIVAGTGISITTLNPGADETLSIAATGSAVDEKVKVSGTDTVTDYLINKIVAGFNIFIPSGLSPGDQDLTINAFPSYMFFADQMFSPFNADWYNNNMAVSSVDSNNASLIVRLFDDNTIEGVGLPIFVPLYATSMYMTTIHRAETTPEVTVYVNPQIACRKMPSTVSSWVNTVIGVYPIAANELWNYTSSQLFLTTIGLQAGAAGQIELMRKVPAGGDTLTGDWAVLGVHIRFI